MDDADREMLKLAANAAGIDYTISPHGNLIAHKNPNGGWMIVWNPLINDGDSLRLAVKLGIAVQLHPAWVYARAVMPNNYMEWMEITEGWGNTGEPYAATRRAIVRAAAEIGRAMP